MKTDSNKKAILKAAEELHQLKLLLEETQQKADKKIWQNIGLPFTLKEGLNRLTKNELDDIRKQLNIRNASQLRKAELIDVLEENILQTIGIICSQLDRERYDIIRKIAVNGEYTDLSSLERHQILFLRSIGIIFTGTHEGKRKLLIPNELIEEILHLNEDKQIRQRMNRNTEWIKLTQGLLYYYGTLDLQQLIDFMRKYTDEPLHVQEYLSIIDDAATYYEEIDIDRYGFSNMDVIDPLRVKREQQMRESVPFYPFTKKQLLRAGEPGYVERNESYRQFVRYLQQNYDMTEQIADEIVEDCVALVKDGGSPNELITYLGEILEFDSLQAVEKLMEKLIPMMNNTREWFLKGHTSEELFAQEKKLLQPLPHNKNNVIDFTTKKKIGRNDPCPCGSKKKYKKCCGK